MFFNKINAIIVNSWLPIVRVFLTPTPTKSTLNLNDLKS